MLHDTIRKPRILLVSTRRIPVPTKVSHQHNHRLNHISLRRTVSTIYWCLPKKCPPDLGVGSSTIPKQKPLKIKKAKQTRRKFKNDLDPKVYPTLLIVPSRVASYVIRWEKWLVLCFMENVAVIQSRHRLFFYPIRKGWKEQERPLNILSLGVGYEKGRC